jgi:hypothetical protein
MTTLHSFTLNGALPSKIFYGKSSPLPAAVLAAWASPEQLRALPDTLIMSGNASNQGNEGFCRDCQENVGIDGGFSGIMTGSRWVYLRYRFSPLLTLIILQTLH